MVNEFDTSKEHPNPAEHPSWENTEGDGENQEQVIQNNPPGKAEEKKEAKKTSNKTNHSQLQPKNLQFILDIPLQLTVELGRTRLLVNDLLQLSQGSVIELTKQVGEPFEVLVNQKLIARGEVVVVNDKFGVRLTDIISPMERVEQLR